MITNGTDNEQERTPATKALIAEMMVRAITAAHVEAIAFDALRTHNLTITNAEIATTYWNDVAAGLVKRTGHHALNTGDTKKATV